MPATARDRGCPHTSRPGIVWGCSFLFIKVLARVLDAFRRRLRALRAGRDHAASSSRASPRPITRGTHRVASSLGGGALSQHHPGNTLAVAETRTTSIVAGIINALTPLTTLFFMLVVFRDEPMQRYQLVGLGVGLCGVFVVLGVWQGLGRNPWWAVAALLGCRHALRRLVSLHAVDTSSRRDSHPSPSRARSSSSRRSRCCPRFSIDGTNGHWSRRRPVLRVLALWASSAAGSPSCGTSASSPPPEAPSRAP